MAESLPFQNNRLWNTALTTTCRVRWMVLTVVVYSVPLILREGAILTVLVACMCICTLLLLWSNEAIEGVVLSIHDHTFIFVHAVWTLLVFAMIALRLCWQDWCCSTNASWAFCRWGVIASAHVFFYLFSIFALFLLLTLSRSAHAIDTFLSWDMIASGCLSWRTRLWLIRCGCSFTFISCINHIAEGVDCGTRWSLHRCSGRHVCILVTNMQNITVLQL